MFNFFRRKKAAIIPTNYSFESKLAVALNHFNEKGRTMLFPAGPKQAEAILKSIAKLIEVNLDDLSSKQFFDIFQLYSDTFIRCMMPHATDEKVINFLLANHSNAVRSQETAQKLIAYIALNQKNPLFALNVYSDFELLYSFISGATDPTSKNVDKEQSCKHSTYSVFYDAYYAILKSLEKVDIVDKIVLRSEVAYLLLAIADNFFSNITVLCIDSKKWFYDLFKCNSVNTVLDSRLSLYKSVIQRGTPRGEWLLGNISSIVGNPLLCCITLFGDILINPDCAIDYENAPLRIVDIFETASFAEIMQKQVFQAVSHLKRELSNIYSDSDFEATDYSYNNPEESSHAIMATTEYSRIQEEFGNEAEEVIKYWAPLYYLKTEIISAQDSGMLSNLLSGLEQIVIREKGYGMLQSIRKISRIADERKLSEEIGVEEAIKNKDPRFRWFE